MYKRQRIRYKGKICESCGVELTKNKVRRERMGNIELAAPVSHIWYFQGIPSRMGLMLDISPRILEKILYFALYIVTVSYTHLDVYKRQSVIPVSGQFLLSAPGMERNVGDIHALIAIY